jgi:putative spermidine/putrescine transport system ATP-binding protein
VVSSSFLGSIRRTVVTLGDGTPVSIQHAVRDQLQVGDQVRVRFVGQPASVEA